nr:hypothetical protein [Tanacetum cinerariifolium]
MAEEGGENVYDIGYGFGNPCRYLQEVFKGFLKCLGFENQDDGGGVRGGDMDDPPPTSTSDDPSTMDDPTDQPISSTGTVQRRAAPRRAPTRPPISSAGPGQTN